MADDFTSQLNAAFGSGSSAPPVSTGDDDFTSQLNAAFGPRPASPSSDTRNPIYAAVADIPSEIHSAASTALSSIDDNLNPFSAANEDRNKALANPSLVGGLLQGATNSLAIGTGLAAIPALAASPITGASRSVLGHTLSAALPGESYDQGKQDADTLMMLIAPEKGGAPPVIPPNPVGPLGVVKSAGQASGDVGQLQTEYAAAMGNMGPRAQKIAQAFNEQQKSQLGAAQEQVASSLSPNQTVIAESPQEAGNIVSQSMQSSAQAAKDNVRAKYDAAKALPGQIDASAFIGTPTPQPGTNLTIPGQAIPTASVAPTIGNSIKSTLSAGDSPVIIDDKLTPYASAAIQDLDKNASKLIIQNRADPNPPFSANQIAGVNLAGVDQWRKRLVTFRNQAYQSGNGADGRAASAVVDAFDNHIDNAINNGMFSGDPLAVQAWNDARAANADYRSTFTAKKNDPVGRVVQKIVGDRTNAPSIGNDVADFLYGGTGTNPNSLNVGVANRIKTIFGEQSPEWTAVKQGLFNRITKPTPGVTEWGSQRIANNVNKLLNGDGKEMASAVFSPAERQMIQSYGDLHQSLVPPPGTRNPSGTSPFVTKAINAMGSHVGEFAGAILGQTVLPGLPELISAPLGAGTVKGASVLGQSIQARKIAQQMPTTANALKQWQIAAAKAQRNYGPDQARSLAWASTRLSNALQPFGYSLRQVLSNVPGGGGSPGTANASQDQQNIPRPISH